MPVIADGTSEAHKRALGQIGDVFRASEPQMNGRHLRKALAAYLEVRGLGELPFRVRSTARCVHGSERFSLDILYPAPSEAWTVVELPEGFHADLQDFAHSWFGHHERNLLVSSRPGRGLRSVLTWYSGWRILADPWFWGR